MANLTVSTLKEALEKNRDEISVSLNDTMKTDFFIKSVMMSVHKNPKLLNCEPTSVVTAIQECAMLGLFPSTGLISLIPYKGKAKAVIEYKGLIALASDSGKVSAIDAEVVYDSDKFIYQHGSRPFLDHTPTIPRKEGDKIKCAYALVRFKDGGIQFRVMDKPEIDAIKDSTGYFKDGVQQINPVWNSHYNEMAKKTVFRRLAKMLDLSPKFNYAANSNEEELQILPPEPVEQPKEVTAPSLKLQDPNEVAKEAEELFQ